VVNTFYHILESRKIVVTRSKVALITGGSRGIGAATAIAFASRDYDVAVTYRNKVARAAEVIEAIEMCGQRGLSVGGDITKSEDVQRLFATFKEWRNALDVLVLNASGGLERDLLAADPDYAMHINRDAQLLLVENALPLMAKGSTIIFVTSHWAYLYGKTQQIPAYAPIAASKYAGEQALRAQQAMLASHGVRLLIVTGDMIEDSITPRLLERSAPGLIAHRRATSGPLPDSVDMSEAIVNAAEHPSLPSGHTVVVGGTLESHLTIPFIHRYNSN